MVETAHTASNTHPHWKAVLDRLEPRLGHNKAIVAIARKLLVAVWHVLAHGDTDRFAEPELVARKLLNYAYLLGKANRDARLSTAGFVRQHLDALGLGADLEAVTWGGSKPPVPLPPANLAAKDGPAPGRGPARGGSARQHAMDHPGIATTTRYSEA